MWLLLGCFGDPPREDPGFDTGGVADVDVDVDADGDSDRGEGDAVITIRLESLMGTMDCAGAGVSEIRLDRAPDEIVVPCDDAPVEWFGITAGEGDLHGIADSEYGVLYEGTIETDIASDATNELLLVLECNENGVLDGCGGA